ncbi:MAG: hypothetical protein RLZ98_3679 [Pseudomonadota bacterium]
MKNPRLEDYDFDLEHALQAVVEVKSTVPEDAFSAKTLGTERLGNGVLVRADGLVLTIGYLVTEASSIWLTLADGQVIPGHVMAHDQETGFALVQALARLDLPALEFGNSAGTNIGDSVVVGGAGGIVHSVAATVIAKQEFTGYWEYALDEAIFTAPAHPHWGGTALIGPDGDLLGIGSLQMQQTLKDGSTEEINMMVPIDLLKPVLDDLLVLGRPNKPARPWLGVYATEVGNRVVIAGTSQRGPARRANIKTGDIVLGVGDQEVRSAGVFFRQVWSLGDAGVEVPLLIYRDGQTFEVTVQSDDRRSYLKGPTVH